MEKLDKLDRKILYELDLDARMPASKLAKKLRRSKETVNFRINRLLKDGCLGGFYGIFNASALGWYYVKAYIRFRNITPEKEGEIFGYLGAQPHIAYLASVEGYYDLVVLVMVRESGGAAALFNPFMKKYGDYIEAKDITTFLSTHRLNQKFFTPDAETRDLSYPVRMGNYKLDEADMRILELLSENARMPLSEMAKRVGADPKVVKYRVDKLERDKIILGYVTSPDFGKLGLQFFQINISFKDPTAIPSALSYFDSTNRCLFFMEMLGKYDAAAELHVEDAEGLRKILDGFKEKFADAYTTYDVLTVYKQYKMVWSPFR